MATTISHGGGNSGFQAGVIHGNIGNITVVQSESLNQACLRDLRTTNPLDDKERIKDTKGGLLKDAYYWILENKEFRQWHGSQGNSLLWIRGDPGKGKTMLICGIIEELTRLYGQNANISFFFCQATDMRINSATSVLRGLIYLLVTKQPSCLHHVQAQYDYAGKTLFEDVNAFHALSKIFRDILSDQTLQMTYLVIDALDECTDGLSSLLDLITRESSAHPQVKWVVSSRNWPDIAGRLENTTQVAPVSLELNMESVSEAVGQFIQHKVRELAKAKRYSEKVRDAVQRYLLSNSEGTFLWVALVCQNLGKIRTNVLGRLKSFPPGLDALYGRMVEQVHISEDAQVCKEILAIMSAAFRPITLNELTSIIKPLDDECSGHALLKEIIGICGSFLTLRGDSIMFVHQSAKEFLLQEATNEILSRGIEDTHYSIFAQSLEVMFQTLRRDIFDIGSPGIPAMEISTPSPNPLAAAEYACVYWVDHLQKSQCEGEYELALNDERRLKKFLQKRYLHWLEALSILRSVSGGIQAIQKLEILIKETSESETLLHQAQDASRFIQYHKAGIESSPLQVYYSPLLFSPKNSFISGAFQKERPHWALNIPVLEEDWSVCLQTLEGHSHSVSSIAWDPDRNRLASASADATVKIWDPATGNCVSTLEEHNDSVNSVAWSPDGNRLASASDDNTVRIWDPATGHSVSTLKGHSCWLSSITWSPDGKRLASISDDSTVRIWDPATGHIVSILEGHISLVRSIAWRPDSSQLASASDDNTVMVWDLVISHYASTLHGHLCSVSSISWSPDTSRLASASLDKTVRIWDLAAGRSASILEGHSHSVNSIIWSPDGSRLASASEDNTVKIWDPATDQCLFTLEGHLYSVTSIVWSPDGSQLASASDDNTVRIWNAATGHSVSTLKGHRRWLSSITWSLDGSQLASASSDNTVRIWNPPVGNSIPTLEGHSDWIHSIVWSPDGSRLASASDDNTVRIWDPVTGQSVSTIATGFISTLQFDKANSNCLNTNAGTFYTGSVVSAASVVADFTPRQSEYGLSDDLSWITCNGLRLLWLPADYRPAVPSLFALYATTVAIACASGRVIFLALPKQCHIPTTP